MIPRRQSFVHDLSPKPFSPTQLRSSTVDPSSDESEIARFVENICSNGDCLHLRPQHMWATQIGHVYPAGTVVGVSGGDTWDTGGKGRGYSTGPHLCVQTLSGFRSDFPATRDSCH